MLEGLALLLGGEVCGDAPVASIEDRLRHATLPIRVHTVVKLVDIDLRILAVVGKLGAKFREKTADNMHIRVRVKTDAEDR